MLLLVIWWWWVDLECPWPKTLNPPRDAFDAPPFTPNHCRSQNGKMAKCTITGLHQIQHKAGTILKTLVMRLFITVTLLLLRWWGLDHHQTVGNCLASQKFVNMMIPTSSSSSVEAATATLQQHLDNSSRLKLCHRHHNRRKFQHQRIQQSVCLL